MQVANEAFLEETGFQVSPVGPLVLLEDQEFDAMGRQIGKADLQDRSQEARSDAVSGVLHGDAPEPNALVGAPYALQDCETGDVCSLPRQKVSGRRVFQFGGVLPGVPTADQTRVAIGALDEHDGGNVRFDRGLNVHGLQLGARRLIGQRRREKGVGSMKYLRRVRRFFQQRGGDFPTLPPRSGHRSMRPADKKRIVGGRREHRLPLGQRLHHISVVALSAP
jgi:hypothetical protein